MMKIKLLAVFILLIVNNLFAQHEGKGRPLGEKPKGVPISGVVVGGSGDVISYAAISLHSARDSIIVKGTATDGDGVFTLRTRPGSYFLKISFLSFEEKTISIEAKLGEPLALGEIELQKGSLDMSEVEIVGEKSTMELTLDKRVYNIGKDISNAGSSADEILDNVPSVTVDQEGNVNLRGSQNVRILVDGKPSGMVRNGDINALKNLQGDLIEKIEVITNPSARYDAEGEVGIINIVLKKDKKEGVNGSFNVFTGLPHNHGVSFNLNWRKKKMNLFASYGLKYRRGPGSAQAYRELYLADTTFVFESDRVHNRGGLSNNIRLGSDFLLKDKNTLTVSGSYQLSSGNNNAFIEYTDYDEFGTVYQTVERFDDEIEGRQNIEGSIGYRKLFEQKGREFTIDAKYNDSKDEENSEYFEEIVASANLPIEQQSSNTENEWNVLLQSDYIHPFKKDGKLEVGVKGNLREIQNDYGVDELVGAAWEPLANFNNNMVYSENIYAGYLIAGNKVKKFSYQLGLRSEYSDIKTDLKETNEVNHRTYFNMFPSAHFTYELKSKNSFQWSYSRRINRPHFRQLLPFFGYSDSRSFFSGNPNLNPEYVNSFELGHMKNWEAGSLLSSVYYRYKTDVSQRIVIVDSTGFTRTFPVNLATENDYGIEFTFSKDIKKILRFNGNFNFYRAITSGKYLGIDYSADTYTWSSRLTAKVKLPKKYDFQTSFMYRGPKNVSQGRRLAMYGLDIGLSKNLLKDKATLTFSVRDLLNTRRHRSITVGDNFYSESNFQWRQRQFLLNFSYRLNQKPGKGSSGKGKYQGVR
jgi:outer membrane receptor protein involved in Fe transport